MKLKLELKSVPKESTVIVGVSGGRDSMALVHALIHQRPDLKIIPAHVNHGLRDSADDDALFTRGMMQRWGLDCEFFKPHLPEGGNVEEWGREKRYEFFEKLLKKHHADFIFTAHHQDDDFETMLLHVLRGTRVKGLAGMAPIRDKLIRPLLYTPGGDITAYVEAQQIPFRNDPTNEDDRYMRNFLRHKIIPVLNHVYPGLAERWQTQKGYWNELQVMLENAALNFMQEFWDSKDGLHREAFKKLPYPLRATVLELWYLESTGKRIPDNATLDRWDEAIRTLEPRKKTEWEGKRFLVMSRERAKLSK
ncbi:MAG: tRNA lysidine(34) synthetase TilS [Candidatus Gracilibacteria bacterium]